MINNMTPSDNMTDKTPTLSSIAERVTAIDTQLRAACVTPAELIGEQVLRALRAGATRVIVTVDKEAGIYLLAPPTGRSKAAIMAERPGQDFDFAKGTWVDSTTEGYDANGGSVAGVGVLYLEAPGEAAINASDPSGLRATR